MEKLVVSLFALEDQNTVNKLKNVNALMVISWERNSASNVHLTNSGMLRKKIAFAKMGQAKLKMETVLSVQFMDKLILKRVCVNVKMGISEMV